MSRVPAPAGDLRVESGSPPRLVTLTGPGGSGKTRLALEVARRLGAPFHGAVWFVPLADLASAELIPAAILQALCLPRAPNREPLNQIVEALTTYPSLLVLDNFEHLVEEGALLIRDLLERLPALTCLVTSRQVLSLTGEQEFPVAPLPVPGVQAFRCSGVQGGESSDPEHLNTRTPVHLADCPSVQLFVDRAQAVRPDFQITARNAAAIAELCRQLEGIPLAVELAAAWSRVLSPAQMLGQLEHRFEFLVGRRRDLPGRHGTLRAAIDWSYQLLPPDLQRFFARLSVFRGGWTVEAAAAVCEEPRAADFLARLHEASLLLADEGETATRFRLLETLREYGWEQLSPDQRERLADHHAHCYLSLGEEAEPRLKGPCQELWFERLETNHENLRAVLAWSLTDAGDAEIGLRLAGAVWWFWDLQYHVPEGRAWLRSLLGRCTAAAPSNRAKALIGAAFLAYRQGDFVEARAFGEESLRLYEECGNLRGLSSALGFVAEFALVQEDLDRARALLDLGEALGREIGNTHGLAYVCGCRGRMARRDSDYPRSVAWQDQALALFREAGDTRILPGPLGELGDTLIVMGDYARAAALFEEQVALHHQTETPGPPARALFYLATLATCQANYGRAQALFEQCLARFRGQGETASSADALYHLGIVAESQGDTATARARFGESLAIWERTENPWAIAAVRVYLAWLALHEGDLPGARSIFEEVLTTYRELNERRGVAFALLGLATAHHRQGNTITAACLLKESLAIRRGTGERKGIAECLEQLGHVWAAQGQTQRAARLYGAAEALREAIGAPIPPVERARYAENVAAARTALGEGAMAAAWEEGRALPLEAVLEQALREPPPR